MTAHQCATCGRTLREGRWSYSRWTRSYYCQTDYKACRARAKRRANREQVPA